MSSGVITKDKTDERGRLLEDVSRRKENTTGFRKDRREHLVFPKVTRKDERKKTFRNGSIRI